MFNRANLTPVEAAVGGSGGKPGRCFASVTGPQADDTGGRAIALGTTRSTINALRTAPKAFASEAHATAKRTGGFTLAELLVTMGVLLLLVFLFTQLLNSAATTMTLGNKRMDADSQARQLLDRMAIDFDQMLKRNDVSYYVKTLENTQAGNDQIAFFSAVPGYYSQAAYNTNASLVAYRVNADSASASYNKLERMGKGLALNGAYTTSLPLLFLDNPPNPTPTPTPSTTIDHIWPAATSSTTTDSDYETAGPQVFRFEYYYLLKSANGYTLIDPSPPNNPITVLSSGVGTYTVSVNGTPTIVSLWSSGINSFVVKDVAAIVVAIATIEPKSKALLTDSQIATLAGTLIDYGASAAAGCPSPNWQTPGELQRQWQCVLDANTSLPRPAIAGIRLYERYFYLYQ